MPINMDREMLRSRRIRAMQTARENNPSTAARFAELQERRFRQRRQRDAAEALAGGLLSDEARAMVAAYVQGVPCGG